MVKYGNTFLNAFNTYVGRLGSMTVGAQNLTQVAIYYGIDTVGGEYRAPDSQNLYDSVSAARKNDALVGNVATKLRENGLDYVFLDDRSMQGGSVKDGAMCVGNFAFTTVIVPDVELFPGHIACSSASRSEIVVPVFNGDEVVAVLDIDSEHLATFDETDKLWLERIAALFARN